MNGNIQYICKKFGVEWEGSPLQHIIQNELELGLTEHKGLFVAGGSLVRHLMGQNIFNGDIDVYGRTKTALLAYKKFLEKKGLTQVYKSKYCYCYELKVGMKKIKVQLITNNYGPATTITEGFDLTASKLSVDGVGNFTYKDFALLDISNKELSIDIRANIHNPVWTFDRILKYKEFGFIKIDDALRTVFDMVVEKLEDAGLSGSWPFGTVASSPEEDEDLLTGILSASIGGKIKPSISATAIPVTGGSTLAEESKRLEEYIKKAMGKPSPAYPTSKGLTVVDTSSVLSEYMEKSPDYTKILREANEKLKSDAIGKATPRKKVVYRSSF